MAGRKRGGNKTFNGVKVFSATMLQQREQLSDLITDWIAAHPSFAIKDIVITQSSDDRFHCFACTFFYFEPLAAEKAARIVG